jgi:hypothetical protein
MHLNRDIYWNEKIQKVRWTKNASDDIDFQYVGPSTQNELELIVEKLFELFEDDKITHRTFMTVYNGYKEFSENLNDILDD